MKTNIRNSTIFDTGFLVRLAKHAINKTKATNIHSIYFIPPTQVPFKEITCPFYDKQIVNSAPKKWGSNICTIDIIIPNTYYQQVDVLGTPLSSIRTPPTSKNISWVLFRAIQGQSMGSIRCFNQKASGLLTTRSFHSEMYHSCLKDTKSYIAFFPEIKQQYLPLKEK
jgi:hypothetical protein